MVGEVIVSVNASVDVMHNIIYILGECRTFWGECEQASNACVVQCGGSFVHNLSGLPFFLPGPPWRQLKHASLLNEGQ